MLARPPTRGRCPVGLGRMQAGAQGGTCGCWLSRTHKRDTLSITEAEYVALADTVKEAMFMQYAWSFMFPCFVQTCITVFEDVWGARHLTQPSVHVEIEAQQCGTPFV